MTEDPLAFARQLVEAGIPVLACPPGGTVDGYQLPRAWQTLDADPRRLEVYRPGHALIAVCGVRDDGFRPSGVDVIDLDPRNGGTMAALRAAMGPVNLPSVVAMVTTPSGGIHLYVPAQGLAKGPVIPGVDYQAGTGLREDGTSDRGFVWIPPTVRTPRTGPRAGQPTSYGLKMALVADRLGAAHSEAFKQWVLSCRERSGSSKPDKGPLSAPEGPVRAGGRDNDATAYAASLRRRGLDWEEARALQEVRWRTYEQPAGDPFPLKAALAKLDTAWGRFEPREEPLNTTAGFKVEGLRPEVQRRLVAVPDDPEGFVRPERPEYEYADWEALAAAPPAQVEWLIPGIIAAGRGHLLYSPTGQGKSLLMLEWAATMAKAGTRVLYCDWENSLEHDVWPRLAAMGFEPADLVNLRFLSFPAFRPLDVDGQELVAQALEQDVSMVVIDTASRTIKGPENDNDTWNAWDRATGIPLRRAGIGFVRLDHSGKDLERGARGGSAKGTDVDLVWRLDVEDGPPITVVLVNEKPRIPVPDLEVAFRRELEPLRHVRIGEETARLERGASKLTALWEAMDRLQVDPSLGRDAVAAILRDEGLKFDTGRLAAVLRHRKLWVQGKLVVPPPWAPVKLALKPREPQGWTVPPV